jgi:predicted nicotinamide N-methyase
VKLFITGIELGIFDHLSRPVSADIVAEAIQGHGENTRIFLDGLAAIDLVQKKDGLYQNTPVAQNFLVKDTETYLGWEFASISEMWQTIDDLPGLIKNGPPSSSAMDFVSEEFWEQLTIGMANSERAGSAQLLARIVSKLPEFPYFRKMLDLGGGPGLIGIAIIAAHLSMKGVIFDRPAIVKIAGRFIEEYEMTDRMAVMSGDYLEDSIGEEYDLILASATLNFAKYDLDSLIKKIYDALNPNGIFISYADGLTHERTKPVMRALENIPHALMNQDMYFDQGFVADSMLRNGFKSVRSTTLDTNWGPMDLDIGRK